MQREIEKTYRSFDNLQVISTPGTGEVKMSITSKKVDELKNNIDVLILQIDNLQSKTEKSNIISHLKAGLRLITEDDSNSQQLNIKVTKTPNYLTKARGSKVAFKIELFFDIDFFTLKVSLIL